MVSNSSGNRLPPIAPPYGATIQSTQGKGQVNQANPQPNCTVASSSGPRCFKCGEAGHRMADCKKSGRYSKSLFIESEECTDDHLNTPLSMKLFMMLKRKRSMCKGMMALC